jgi:glucose-1-phosphate cytidylyltransferase
MKAVILAGGLGTRLSEETHLKPKPMVEIGGKPILWHIMKIYSSYGINDFIICAGYRGYVIKEYFANYSLHSSHITFDIATNSISFHDMDVDPWRVTVIDTGEKTMTGGRLKRLAPYLGNEDFCCTYGDGVADIDIGELIAFHQKHALLATMTTVRPPGRFGAVTLDEKKVTSFCEKPSGDGGWINGGFFVLSPKVLDFIENDATIWEKGPLENLAQAGQLAAFPLVDRFWHPMDTQRDKLHLETLWDTGSAAWKKW